ncbi:hypothetical protein AAFF_G00018290, partial [Aldrovandia affinis]
HISPVLASLHWLPINYRVDHKVLLLTYKVLHGLAPSYLTDLLHPYNPPRSLRSQDAGNLVVPRISKIQQVAELSPIELLYCGTVYHLCEGVRHGLNFQV